MSHSIILSFTVNILNYTADVMTKRCFQAIEIVPDIHLYRKTGQVTRLEKAWPACVALCTTITALCTMPGWPTALCMLAHYYH